MVAESRNRADLGRDNRRAVLAQMVLNGPMPRTDIARATRLTMASVSRITRDLIDADLLEELPEDDADTGTIQKGPGRRFVRLDVNPNAGYVLGIGVNVFSQSVTLADLKNRRIARKDLKLSDLSDPDFVIEQLTREANDMAAEWVTDRRRLLGASFAITGAVDPTEGMVRTSPYLRWGEVSLGPRLTRTLGVPVRIESLPAALAQAESRFGIAQGIRNLLTVNCSLGIGAALLMDGRLVRGHGFSAGLIGDISPHGTDSGTLDTLAGGHSVLLRLFGDTIDFSATPANELAEMLLTAIDRANRGEKAAMKASAEAGRVLGKALVPFIGLLRPEAFVIAGPMAAASDYVAACGEAVLEQAPAFAARMLVSDMSAQAAARWVAIGEFLMERDLNLEELKTSRAA